MRKIGEKPDLEKLTGRERIQGDIISELYVSFIPYITRATAEMGPVSHAVKAQLTVEEAEIQQFSQHF